MPGSPQPDKLLLRSMRTDCFWPLCPLSPFSTSTLYCLRCKTGQLDSKRSRPTQPTCWAILAHSNLRPFAGNVEGYEDGTSEDDSMGGDLIYPPSPPPTYPIYPTANAMQPYYPPHQFLPSPLALSSTLTPTPWPMVFTLTLLPLLPLPLPTHPQTRKAADRKATRKTRKTRHRLRQRQGHLTPTSLVPLCLALLNCTSIATSMAG